MHCARWVSVGTLHWPPRPICHMSRAVAFLTCRGSVAPSCRPARMGPATLALPQVQDRCRPKADWSWRHARILAFGAQGERRERPTGGPPLRSGPGQRRAPAGRLPHPTSFIYIYYSPLFLILFVCVSVALYRVISLDTLYTSRFRTSMASPLLVIHPPP